MSVTTIDRGARAGGPNGGPGAGGPPEFDRTPPQDVAAEQGVLGGMLLSKDAIADALKPLPLPHEQAAYLTASQLLKLLEAAQRHDAAVFAKMGIPTAMLFIRTPGGLSHHPDESVALADVQAALETCMHFLETLTP